jgi:hypothetical protein
VVKKNGLSGEFLIIYQKPEENCRMATFENLSDSLKEVNL